MGRFPPRLAVSHCNGMSIAMGAQPELVIRWTERGGPPAVAPVGKGGFGTKLVRMGLDGTGQVKLDLRQPDCPSNSALRSMVCTGCKDNSCGD
jgi:hypothetical protein